MVRGGTAGRLPAVVLGMSDQGWLVVGGVALVVAGLAVLGVAALTWRREHADSVVLQICGAAALTRLW
jgi:hypothetical protein